MQMIAGLPSGVIRNLREVSQSRQQEVISLKMITKTVASFYGCNEKSILHAKRGRGEKNLPRWIAMKMSQDLSGLNLETIARHFNIGNYCTVSRTIRRLREEMEWDRKIAGDINSISKDLTPKSLENRQPPPIPWSDR